jgi:outer membrane protein assembly factor BamE (lipoprotein component of BamABCDE complex)
MTCVPLRALLAGCLLLLPAGCVLAQTTEGTSLVAEQVAQLQPGVSTRADVSNLLGAPDEVIYSNKEHDPLFEQAYRYRRTKTRQTALFLILFSTFRSDQKWDHVMVFFDERGVVEHIGMQMDQDHAEYGMPW